MILVAGVTGNIGGALAPMLVAAGARVRALARDPGKASAAVDPRIEVVHGDFTRPETFPAALAGVEKAFFVANAGPELAEVARPFFAAAREAGVRHVVAVSSGSVTMTPATAIARWHAALEQELKATGLAWTMLRPGNFASNSLHWAHTIRAQGAVYSPADGRSAPIDTRDIAAVACLALTKPGHEGTTPTLTGPALMNESEQVEKISRAIGKPIRYTRVPEDAARAGMAKAGMAPVMIDAMMEFLGDSGRSLAAYQTATVRELTGHEPRSFDDWLNAHVADFA